jgi:hypothetical protein
MTSYYPRASYRPSYRPSYGTSAPVITARQDGTCPDCRQAIVAGQSQITKRNSRWAHQVCPQAQEQPVAQQQPQSNPVMDQAQADAARYFANWSEADVTAFKDYVIGWVQQQPTKADGSMDISAEDQERCARLMTAAFAALTADQNPQPVAPAPGPVAPVQQPQPVAQPTSQVPNGYFTAVLDDGTHRTIRIAPSKDGARQWASMLVGQNNEADYAFFGQVLNGVVVQHGKAASNPTWVAIANAIISGDLAAAGLAYAIESNRCWMCNRRLTVPASVHAGVGPDCAKRI